MPINDRLKDRSSLASLMRSWRTSRVSSLKVRLLITLASICFCHTYSLTDPLACKIRYLVRQLYDWNSFATARIDLYNVASHIIRPKWNNTSSLLRSVAKDISMSTANCYFVYNNCLLSSPVDTLEHKSFTYNKLTPCQTLYQDKWKFWDRFAREESYVRFRGIVKTFQHTTPYLPAFILQLASKSRSTPFL